MGLKNHTTYYILHTTLLMLPKFKKIILLIILASFIGTGVFLAFPKPAKAQWVVSDPTKLAWDSAEKILNSLGIVLMEVGSVAIVNSINYFFQKIAYDTAVWVASGGSGQKPLFDGKSAGDYFKSVAQNSLGTFIGEISKYTQGTLGFDLCQPKFPSLLLKIQLGFLKPLNPPTPTCNWSEISSNWESFISSTDSETVLKNVGFMFEPGQNTLSYSLELNNRALMQSEEKYRQAFLERLSKGGWQDVTDVVTGKIKTPAELIKDSFKSNYQNAPEKQREASFTMFSQALAAGGKGVLTSAVSMFANTLLSQVMQNLMSGIFPGSLLDTDEVDWSKLVTGGSSASSPASSAVGRRAAQTVYSDLLKPKVTTVSNYDPLLEFTTCPSSDVEKQVNNCVLDDSFATAVRLASQGAPVTVAEAIKQKYLDGEKPLISSKDSQNGQSSCYQSGYCYGNLVKLRKARILPIGFELAAEASAGSNWKLKDVVKGFNTCNSSGDRDSGNPYCHLIDPNWVLRLPKTQCLAQVYGPTLISTEGAIRSQYCADPITCVSEDESGNCGGSWGYCTREKNIWRIQADKCPAYYNSCLTYKDRNNKQADYVRNTVNFDSCKAGNTGCRPYFQNQKSGKWDNSSGSEIYFNKDIEKCDSANAGCAEIYSKANGLSFNLVKDSSFESVVKTGTTGNSYWDEVGGATNFLTNSSDAYNGSGALDIEDQSAAFQTAYLIKLEYNTAYSLSAYAKHKTSGDTTDAMVGIALYGDSKGTSAFDPSNLVGNCNKIENKILYQSSNPGDSYSRVSCSFLTPSQTLYAKVLVTPAGNSDIYFDAVQLEEGSSATTYLSGGYGTVTSVNMKVAPDYLSSTCDAGTTSTSCSGYLLSCKESEVGCEKYTPKTGEPAVAGSITVNDICPSSCVGYETYKQEKTLFEAEKYPNYFIPATAKSCSANEVGCDEFTNLADESKEYFTSIRQCIKTGEEEDATFYTWEGSDTSGYQLKSHKLKTGLPQAGEFGPAPDYITGTSYASCTKTIFQAKIGDADYDADCREFYNANGDVSYRLLSKTIISTSDCSQYRKTESTQTDCDASGGNWDSNKQYCLYKGYKAESKTCSSTSNKCRAYSGASSSNLRIVLQDDFESSGTDWSGGSNSSEALSAGGHSYKLTAVGNRATASRSVSSLISANTAYTLNFWAKAPSSGDLEVLIYNPITSPKAQSFKITGMKADWRLYQVGPMYTDAAISQSAALRFIFTGAGGFYIDNVILNEASSKLYLIKNSWSTPAVCDQTSSGAPLPQAMLGCKEYADSNKSAFDLKSFSSLCRDAAVGCKAYQQTYNSSSEKNELYNAICALSDTKGGDCKFLGETACSIGVGSATCRFDIDDLESVKLSGAIIYSYPQGSYKLKDYSQYESYLIGIMKGKSLTTIIVRDESAVEVLADKTAYLVYDKTKTCQSTYLGCSALGQPELYSTSTASSATTVYYKNKPDNYSKLLCSAEAEGCESWTQKNGVDYFKTPQQTCEYKEGVGSGSGSSGWFKKGTTDACYSGYLADGDNGIWKNADAGYDGSVGVCSSQYSGCAEFIDPLDTSSVNKKGKPYYLIDNSKLQTLEKDQSCGGKVSLTEGCVLFNKTSDLTLKWTASSTYYKADQEQMAVSPVEQSGRCTECVTSGSSPFQTISCSSNISSICFKDSDCAPSSPLSNTTYKCTPSTVKDANTILKVTRDRECGEWLACKTSYSAYDPITKKSKLVCAELGLCDKAGSSNTCANFISNSDGGKILTADYYSQRETSWKGGDYSGYSLSNKYPITDYAVTKKTDTSSKTSSACQQNDGTWDTKTSTCTIWRLAAKSGSELIDGTTFSTDKAEKSSCRGYAEQDSPFPNSLGVYDSNGVFQNVTDQNFKNANICDKGENCECDYSKLSYGSSAQAKKYTTYGNREVNKGICQGSTRDGQSCTLGVTYDEDPEEACGKSSEGGSCLQLKRQDDVIGLKGYCLERDSATPINGDKKQKACLTWLPQDIISGTRDMFNQYKTAGYVPPIGGGKYYCIKSAANRNPFMSSYEYPIIHAFTGIPGKSSGYYGPFTKSGIKYAERDTTTKQIKSTRTKDEITKDTYYDISDYKNIDSYGKIWGLTEKYSEDVATTAGISVIYINGTEIYKHEIDYIKIKFISTTASDSFQAGAVFYIRPDQATTKYISGSACDSDTTTNCAGEEEGTAILASGQAAKSIVSGDEWQFRYDDGQQSGGTKQDHLAKDVFKLTASEFSAYCDNGAEFMQSGFWLKLAFDSTSGKLNGLKVAGCANSTLQPPTDYLVFSLTAVKREVCDTVGDFASFKNQALTDNVWVKNAKNTKKEYLQTWPDTSGKTKTLPYHYDYEIQPFGSASSDIAPLTSAWYSYYISGKPTFAGVSWGFVDSKLKSGAPSGITASDLGVGTPKESNKDLTDIDFDPTKQTTKISSAIIDAQEYLGALFNKVYKIFTIDKSNANKDVYKEIDCEMSGNEECTTSVDEKEEFKYPQIFSFNPGKKLKNGQYALDKENKFLINNQSSDISVKSGQYLAKMRFYFWADTNHMPVKSIKVDWGDGSVIETFDGMYKNHKPICAPSNTTGDKVCSNNNNIICSSENACPEYKVITPPSGSECFSNCTTEYSSKSYSQTCNSGTTVTFGNSPDACDESYFELQHNYTCSSGTCAFSPKLWITDNWEIKSSFEPSKAPSGGLFGPATGPKITLSP